MIDTLLSFVAPHHCCGCGIEGTLLCDNCKYNISNEPFERCLLCGELAGVNGICARCKTHYSRLWCVGERADALQNLIGSFKFSRANNALIHLAGLLHDALPHLPPETVIVPIPTVAPHIRERGYDHMALIARRLAKQRGLAYQPHLKRASVTTQRGANKHQRAAQAKTAFRCQEALSEDIPYLIVDDVVTTGATLKHAAKELHRAGARQIWGASISRQPK